MSLLTDLMGRELKGTSVLNPRERDSLLRQLTLLERDLSAIALTTPPASGGSGNLDNTYLRLDTANDPLTGSLQIRSTAPQVELRANHGDAYAQYGGEYTTTTGETVISGQTEITDTSDWSSPGGVGGLSGIHVLGDGITAFDTIKLSNSPQSFTCAISPGPHLPSGADISGVQFTIYRCANSVTSVITDVSMYLTLNGVPVGDNKSNGTAWNYANPISFSGVTFGGVADNWNAGITADDINAGKVGIIITYSSSSALDCLIYIDYLQFTINSGTAWIAGLDYSNNQYRIARGSTFDDTYVAVNSEGQIIIPIATGTSPLSVTSTTINTNLNADLLDGLHAASFPLLGGTPAANQMAYWSSATTIAGDALIRRVANATNQQLFIDGADTVYKGAFWKDTTSGEEWALSHRTHADGNRFELYYSPNGSSYTREWYWDISGNALSTVTVGAKPDGTAGIRLDPNAATGNYTLSLSPANLTANRRLTLSVGGDYTLTVPGTGTVALLDYTNAPATGFGVGTAPTANRYVNVSKTYTLTSGEGTAIAAIVSANPASASTGDFRGGFFYASTLGSQNISTVRGLFGQLQHFGTGTLTSGLGLSFTASNNGTGAITSLSGLSAGATQAGTGLVATMIGGSFGATNSNATGGNVTAAYGVYTTFSQTGAGTTTSAFLYRGTMSLSAGAVTNAYGLYLDNISIGGTLNYALYTNAGLNRLGDQVAVVGSADRAQLTVTGYTTQTAAVAQLTRNDGATATINSVLDITANSTGTAAAGLGAATDWYLESSTTADQIAARLSTLWTTATHASRNARMQVDTYTAGAVIGHSAQWSGTAIDGTAQTIIANGTGDVTEAITLVYTAAEITGTDVSGGTVTLEPGDTHTVLTDATNVLTLTCAADGSVTIARSAGTDTFKFSTWMVWL